MYESMTSSPHNPSEPAEENYLRGIEELAGGSPAAALKAFEAALQQDPAMLDALHGMVRAFRECGRVDEAIEAAKKLVVLEPEDALPHTSLSILYQQKGMIAEAEDEATKARLLDWKRQLRTPSEPNSLT